MLAKFLTLWCVALSVAAPAASHGRRSTLATSPHAELLAAFDADGNGQLNVHEFEKAFRAIKAIRSMDAADMAEAEDAGQAEAEATSAAERRSFMDASLADSEERGCAQLCDYVKNTHKKCCGRMLMRGGYCMYDNSPSDLCS